MEDHQDFEGLALNAIPNTETLKLFKTENGKNFFIHAFLKTRVKKVAYENGVLNMSLPLSDDELADMLDDESYEEIFISMTNADNIVTLSNPYYMSYSNKILKFEISGSSETISKIIPPNTKSKYRLKLFKFVINTDLSELSNAPRSIKLMHCSMLHTPALTGIKVVNLSYTTVPKNMVYISKGNEKVYLYPPAERRYNVLFLNNEDLREINLNLCDVAFLGGSSTFEHLETFTANFCNLPGFRTLFTGEVSLINSTVTGNVSTLNVEPQDEDMPEEEQDSDAPPFNRFTAIGTNVSGKVKLGAENIDVVYIAKSKFELSILERYEDPEIYIGQRFEIYQSEITGLEKLALNITNTKTTININGVPLKLVDIGYYGDPPKKSTITSSEGASVYVSNVDQVKIANDVYSQINLQDINKADLDVRRCAELTLKKVGSVKVPKKKMSVDTLMLVGQPAIPDVDTETLQCWKCTFEDFPDNIRGSKRLANMHLEECNIRHIEGKFNAKWREIVLINMLYLESFRPDGLCNSKSLKKIVITHAPRLLYTSQCIDDATNEADGKGYDGVYLRTKSGELEFIPDEPADPDVED